MKNENNDECHVLHPELFEPYFQPIINIKTGACVGLEILARLVKPERITVNHFPEFLTGYSEQCEVTRIMLRKVISLIGKISFPDGFKLSFNIPINLLAEEWLSNICDSFFQTCDYDLILILEITEYSPLLINDDSIKLGLSRLNNKNILIALDDFGNGHSNINLIRKLPIDIIKIPKEFIEPLPNGKIESVIVDSIINLSRGLNVEIIAEGVESTEQSHWLMKKGINLQQGFYFSHPIKKDEVGIYLNKEFTVSKNIDNAMHYQSGYNNNFGFPHSLLIQCIHKYNLSCREKEVLVLIAKGVSVNSISKLKNRSYKTIWSHKNNAYKKLRIKNDADFINHLHMLASAL